MIYKYSYINHHCPRRSEEGGEEDGEDDGEDNSDHLLMPKMTRRGQGCAPSYSVHLPKENEADAKVTLYVPLILNAGLFSETCDAHELQTVRPRPEPRVREAPRECVPHRDCHTATK